MKLTIELNEENIMGFITELEAKGCYEVAKAIEDSYSSIIAKEVVKQAKKAFREEYGKGWYFVHNNGDVEALYFNLAKKTFHRGPLYMCNHLMGQPSSLTMIEHRTNIFRKQGFAEV